MHPTTAGLRHTPATLQHQFPRDESHPRELMLLSLKISHRLETGKFESGVSGVRGAMS